MATIGRNDSCPCGSGRKYKHCCLGKRKTPLPENISGILIDHDKKFVAFTTRDMLVNQLQRDGRQIELSFDNLCADCIRDISSLYGDVASLIMFGVHKYARKDKSIRYHCAQLLLNALNSYTAAVHVLRSGYVLQPSVVLRHCIEMVSVAIHLVKKPEDVERFRTGKLSSTAAIATAKEAVLMIGNFYGELSNRYVHVGPLHFEIQPPVKYEKLNDALQTNLSYLRYGVWALYVATELVFHDLVQHPRFWKKLGEGAFAFDPSDEVREWQKTFLMEGLGQGAVSSAAS